VLSFFLHLHQSKNIQWKKNAMQHQNRSHVDGRRVTNKCDIAEDCRDPQWSHRLHRECGKNQRGCQIAKGVLAPGSSVARLRPCQPFMHHIDFLTRFCSGIK
jgi:hypothetical protein